MIENSFLVGCAGRGLPAGRRTGRRLGVPVQHGRERWIRRELRCAGRARGHDLRRQRQRLAAGHPPCATDVLAVHRHGAGRHRQHLERQPGVRRVRRRSHHVPVGGARQGRSGGDAGLRLRRRAPPARTGARHRRRRALSKERRGRPRPRHRETARESARSISHRALGAGTVILYACRKNPGWSGISLPLYSVSPAIGAPANARCARTWCIRPVSAKQLTSACSPLERSAMDHGVRGEPVVVIDGDVVAALGERRVDTRARPARRR